MDTLQVRKLKDGVFRSTQIFVGSVVKTQHVPEGNDKVLLIVWKSVFRMSIGIICEDALTLWFQNCNRDSPRNSLVINDLHQKCNQSQTNRFELPADWTGFCMDSHHIPMCRGQETFVERESHSSHMLEVSSNT